MDRRILIASCLILYAFSLLLCAPSSKLGLPEDSFLVIFFGLFLTGFFITGVLVPSIPEVINTMQ